MHVVILTQYYPPEIGAPQNRLSDLARRFVERGHRVQVLTAIPNYPESEVFPECRGRSVVSECLDGVPVERVKLYVPQRKTFWRRIAHYSSFAFHSAIRGPKLLDRADFVITESPPLLLAPAGVYLARRLGAAYVLNVSDLWPASALELDVLKPGIVAKCAVAFEEWCYRRAAVILGQSDGIVKDIKHRFPHKPVHLYPNGVDLAYWQTRPKPRREGSGRPDRDFVVGYVGLHGHAQALGQVLAAARMLRDEPHIRIVFFGSGPLKKELQTLATQSKLSNVTFYPAQPHERIREIYAGVDAGLVTLAKGPVFEGVRPSKLFEIMAAGLPVVLAAAGEPARLVADAGCGVVVPPESPHELAEAIRRLSRDNGRHHSMGKKGRSYVATHFDRARIAGKLEDLLLSHIPD